MKNKIKRCTVCNEEKKIEEFSILKSSKDGRNYRCMECNRKICKDHRSKNIDILRQKDNQRYKRDKKKRLICNKKSYERNKEKRRLKMKEHYCENKDAYIKRARDWESKNRDLCNYLNRESAKRGRINVSKGYCKVVLRAQGFKNEDITDELINVKKYQILIRRQIQS